MPDSICTYRTVCKSDNHPVLLQGVNRSGVLDRRPETSGHFARPRVDRPAGFAIDKAQDGRVRSELVDMH